MINVVLMFVEKSLQIDSAILWSDLLPEENATNSMSLVLASRERYQETRDLYVHKRPRRASLLPISVLV